MAFVERVPLIRKLEELRGSKVICYLTSLRPGVPGQMGDDAIRELLDQLLAIPHKPVEKLDLFLCSDGGDSVMPWRLVPVFRHFANSFAVLVPYHAYSAATILALGANEIVMHPFGVLGPIDPTVTNEFNPQLQPGRLSGISVEDVKAYVNFVKQTVGITHEDELVQMLAILAEKVHPLALGNVERFLSQSRLIARKLLKMHMDESVSERDIEDTVENLASKLYFHGHPINRSEAEKELRLKIAKEVPAEVENVMWKLYTDFEAEFRNREPFQPFVELANTLQPWSIPAAGAAAPVPQLAHQTHEIPLAIVESGTSSSVQRVRKRFTLISALGQPDQQRQETLGVEWVRVPAPEPPAPAAGQPAPAAGP